MRIGFVKISMSMVIMMIALLIIFVPMWLNRFSDTPTSREKIPIPPALLEVATQVDSRVNGFFSSPLIPLSQQLTDLAKVFVLTDHVAQVEQASSEQAGKEQTMPLTGAMQARAWLILVGRYDSYQQAQAKLKQLEALKFNAIILHRSSRFSVFIGPVYNKNQAMSLRQKLNGQLKVNGRMIRFTPKRFQPYLIEQDKIISQPTQQEKPS